MANPLSEIAHLIDRGDFDGLVRTVDDLCSSRDWSSLLQLRNACRLATASGKQLWPASTLAEYRLALLAPAHIAAQVVVEGSGRFTLGPLTEVIAQSHQWSELQHELPHSPIASFVAHECALRGQHIENPADIFDALETPLELQEWEPNYALAVYRDNSAEFPSPELPPTSTSRVVAATSTPKIGNDDDDVVVDAVHQLVGAWTTSSNGTLQVGAARGDETHALASLGIASATLRALQPTQALALVAWAGASGGAFGRRRGAAAGRDSAWWLLGALSGRAHQWPLDNDEIGDVLNSVNWWWFDADQSPTGWQLQLVIVDKQRGLSWAINARDSVA
ncbi:MAG: hypothetical protein D4R44_05940 [Actinobacteria bacterium]|nr:MAG: hypothetical protein D4R44_05940 [Actinomycetota bacterium]